MLSVAILHGGSWSTLIYFNSFFKECSIEQIGLILSTHIMNLHCTILYSQQWLTIGRILGASGGQAGLQGVAMIYGPACV